MTCTVNTDGHDTPGGAHGRKLGAPNPLEFVHVHFHVLHSAPQVLVACISLRIYFSSDLAQHLEAFHQDVHGEADGVRLCTLAHRTVEEVERATRVQPELHACMCARAE